jgi:hypothetical protein
MADEASADWTKFQPHQVGTVKLYKGRREMSIIASAKQKGWNMAIKKVTLTKVQ